MDELRESSLLFSLESLMETERERVQREAREARKRRDEELRRTAEAAERRLVAAEQQQQARERRLALEREREQLDDERIEALKCAAIERVRIEAEARARLFEAEQERDHALKLAKLREEQRTGRYRVLAWLSSGALLLLLGSTGFAYFGQLRPAHAGQQLRYEALLATERERTQLIDRAMLAERSRSEELERQLTELKKQATAVALAQIGSEPSLTAPKPAPEGKPKPPPHVGPCRDDGDPLNPSLSPCGPR